MAINKVTSSEPQTGPGDPNHEKGTSRARDRPRATATSRESNDPTLAGRGPRRDPGGTEKGRSVTLSFGLCSLIIA